MSRPIDRYRAKLDAGLRTRDEAKLLRRCERPTGVDLTSNDVLGFATDPVIAAQVSQQIATHGTGSGASRLLRGHSELFDDVEARLASFSGREASLLFSSGFAANVGLLSALIRQGDLVASDALNHASIIDGLRLCRGERHIFRHQAFDALEEILALPCAGQRFIVTESLFSMDGDLTDLTRIVDLADSYDALVIVDEAHATGLYGARGSGRVESLGLSERVLCSVHTGGKALGVGGAWVAGDQALISWLVNHARSFIYSTATVPAIPLGLRAAIDRLGETRDRVEQLHANADMLRRALRARGLDIGPSRSHVIPIMIGESGRGLEIANRLKSEGFDARAVRPPTVPDGTTRLRVAVRSALTSSELNRFVEALATIMTTLGQDDST